MTTDTDFRAGAVDTLASVSFDPHNPEEESMWTQRAIAYALVAIVDRLDGLIDAIERPA